MAQPADKNPKRAGSSGVARTKLARPTPDGPQHAAEIEHRRAAVDKLYDQAVQARDQARHQQQQLAALKRQLDAREAELRRGSLQSELDRQRLAQERVALQAERAELERAQAALREAGAQDGAAQPVTGALTAAVPVRYGWRGLVLSAVAGLTAAFVWLAIEQPRYRGVAEMRVASERGSPERVTAEHADWLMSGGVVEHWQGPPPVEAWTAACDEQRLVARPLPRRGVVQLTFQTGDGTLAESLLPAAVKAYQAYVADVPLDQFRWPRLLEWEERRAALEHELTRLCDHVKELQGRLDASPASAAWSVAQRAFEQALSEFKAIVDRVRDERDKLVAMESQELPRGEVNPEEYQRALTEDPLYQEDLKEFDWEARKYRGELAASMALLAEPLQGLRNLVGALAMTITEQRDLQPPANVRAVLEQCLAAVNDFRRFLTEFSQTWDRRRETIEGLNVRDQVVELVGQQNAAADAAGRLVNQTQRVWDELKTRVDGLTSKDDTGTRAIVVAAVLRGELTRLAEQLSLVEERVGATNTAVNFKLDAHGRQLAGLRTRLRGRQRVVRRLLQAEADHAARAARDQQESRLRARIGELEQQRQTLIDTLVVRLEQLRELDEQNQEVRQLHAELRAEEAAVVRLEARLGELEAERPKPQRDSIELVGAGYECVVGGRRVRNGVLAGVTTFGAVGLLFVLMLAQRRRPA